MTANTFEWKIKAPQISVASLKLSSESFQICGNTARLYFTNGYKYRSNVLLCLHLYPSHPNQISCTYCSYLTDEKGDECFKIKGRIDTLAESVNIMIIYDGSIEIEPSMSFMLYFSWSADENCGALRQDLKGEQGMLSNRIECGTQTTDTQYLNSKDMQSNPERGSNKFLEILSKDLSSLFENKTDPDCVLKIDETEFPVHRSVLSSRSTVFAAMFHHDTSESQSGEVNILDVDAGALGDVLYYIYAGQVRGLSPETAASMYVVSDKYALIALRDECLNFLTNNLTMENICDAALLAHTHAETDLESKVLQFIEERLEELIQNDNWKTFSDTHPKLSNYLLSSAFKASKNKMMKGASNLQEH